MLHLDVNIPAFDSYFISAKQSFIFLVIISPVCSMTLFERAPVILGIRLNRARVITSSMVLFPLPVGPVIASNPAEASGFSVKSIS